MAIEAPPIPSSHTYVLSFSEAAQFLGISPATLRSWRVKGFGPRSVSYSQKRGASVFYTRDALIDFIHAHESEVGAR